MYCIECGKQISDDAKFCSYCGQDLSDYRIVKTISKKEQMPSPISYFTNSSVIFLILWWTVISISALVYLWIKNKSILPALYVLPGYVALPLFIATIHYISSKKKRINGPQQNIRREIEIAINETAEDTSVIPLLDFARNYGTMQVCRVADKNGLMYSKCIFTKLTEVEFSKDLGELTAAEISQNKSSLIISKTDKGYFEIRARENISINKDHGLCPPPLDKIS